MLYTDYFHYDFVHTPFIRGKKAAEYVACGYQYRLRAVCTAYAETKSETLTSDTTNSTGKPTPASPASPNETRWAWKAVSTVSPKWNEQKTFILNANLWLRTFPTGSGNATYKQIITDYAPIVALSGKSSATLDLSTGGASIKFTANFNHVNIEVLDYAAGLKTTYNLARIRYTVPCTLDPALWSEAKNTLDFPMGVATSNTGNKNACIQLDSQIKLGKYKNLTNYTWYEWPVKYFAWAVPVR